MTTLVASPFESRTQQILSTLKESGQLKHLQTIEGPMGATVKLRGYGEVACFCSNNYLGLADHPEVIEAGIAGLRTYGAGTASVRCGAATVGFDEWVASGSEPGSTLAGVPPTAQIIEWARALLSIPTRPPGAEKM